MTNLIEPEPDDIPNQFPIPADVWPTDEEVRRMETATPIHWGDE